MTYELARLPRPKFYNRLGDAQDTELRVYEYHKVGGSSD